jgi:putative transposase
VFSVRWMCKALKVSPAGYYAWCKRAPSRRQRTDERLLERIRTVHEKSRKTYGYRRVHAALQRQGIVCGKHRVARLMRQDGLRGRLKRRHKTTTQSRHSLPVAPNHLMRDFEASAPNRKWATDITYVWTYEGWLFLAVVLDLYSRLVVGWAMDASLADTLTLKALRMALDQRRPPPGLIHHSDRGAQYASRQYQKLLAAHGAIASMSRTGDVYDNAPPESFFATLKVELIHDQQYHSRQQAKTDIFEYIEVFYNPERLHSGLGYRSPVEFEMLSMSP